MSTRRVHVTVPATSANLGPGFDAFGLALDLHDELIVEATFGGQPEPVMIDITGVGADSLPRDEGHLVVRALRAAFAECGAAVSALRVSCRNALPHRRGLGSSAAAIVAGVAAGSVLVDGALDRPAALQIATDLEGHPDNVAACLFGGLTIAWTDAAAKARAVRLDVHPDVRPIVCVPSTEVSTSRARGLLPETVPHGDAARNAARAGLLVEALTRRPDILLEATEDYLHQTYRAPAMPETIALVRRLREAGHPAVVSGAGPTVLVLARADDQAAVQALAGGWDVRELGVDQLGVTALSLAGATRSPSGPSG